MKIRITQYLFALASGLLAFTFTANAQTRDHLNEKEVELVQEAQILDQRIDIFIKAIDRRLMVLNNTTPTQTKLSKKEQVESDKWGELPKGTRAELIGDIAGILDEAITNIDDVSGRDEKNPLIPKAVRKLTATATQVINQFGPAKEQTKNEAEFSSISQALDNAQLIIEASKKLPAATATTTTPQKSKTKKPKDDQ